MTQNVLTKHVFKIMLCSFFVMVLMSFSADPCAPSDAMVRDKCEYSHDEACWIKWTSGSCSGKIYYYFENRAKGGV